jgi:hypothetical protein
MRFSDFYDRFFARYRLAELEADAAALGDEAAPDSVAAARAAFDAAPTAGAREAAFAIRAGGVTTRTVRNWRHGGAIYSKRSSVALNRLFDRHLPAGLRLDRQRLAWLWMASRLKLDEAEADEFLHDVAGEHRSYALDLTEVVLRLAVRPDPAGGPGWDFFDAVTFSHDLLVEVMEAPDSGDADRPLDDLRRRILDALAEGRRPAGDLADQLCLIYEDALDELRRRTAGDDPEPAAPRPATRLLEDSWRREAPAWPSGAAEARAAVRDWALRQRSLFQAAYLSWCLTVLRLLVDHATDSAKATAPAAGPPLTTRFYHLAARAATPGAVFPCDLADMADTLWYEEGVDLDDRAREVCLVYLGRLLDVPSRVSRGRLAEFYLLARSHHGSLPELNLYLQRHGFAALTPHDGWLPALLDDHARRPATSPEAFAARVAAASGRPGATTRVDKLFRWKHGSHRSDQVLAGATADAGSGQDHAPPSG